jgi:hypothetical protein
MKLRYWLTLAFIPLGARGAEQAPEGVEFFEKKIRPALSKYCYECHAEGEKIKGGLRVDYRDGLIHGGDSGAAVVPGDLEKSLLYTSITWADDDYEMPPKRKMPESVILDFKRWIEMGAPDPRVPNEVVVSSEIDIEKGKEFWAFQKPERAEVPTVKNPEWGESPIDRFVLKKLEEAELAPSGEAGAEILLRRLNFDLVGLPPTVKEIESYAKAWRENPRAAYESKADELLARTQFGERWGKHWLDVARYSDSSGKEVNQPFPSAWRYRDYVIDSLNEDKPYDRFLTEQIAGDLLPIKNDAEWQENLVATGFLAVGPKGLGERNPRQFAMDLADEQIDAMSQAVLGLTVSCARCHDHKSDPIPTTDYYSLAGVFLSTKTYFGTVNLAVSRRATKLLELPLLDDVPVEKLSKREVDLLKDRVSQLEEQMAEGARANRQSRLQGNAVANLIRTKSTLSIARSRLAMFDDEGNAKPFAMGVQDLDQPVDATVLIRGELDKPAQEVERGFLQVLGVEGEDCPEDASGRLELAKWLTSKENPLTSRVMVNRIWGKLFGKGIVGSMDNFGASGELPSHPELLDFLALEFMNDGWSVKAMIRDLVMTKSYRMASTYRLKAFEKDPENRLLWRRSPRRLDAEEIRDAMLLLSGDLDEERPLGTIFNQGVRLRGLRVDESVVNRSGDYRSVYLPTTRDLLPESLALFDGADGNIVLGQREQTNVPGQALYLMNSLFVMERSSAMADLISEETKDRDEFVNQAFLMCFGRVPRDEEVSASREFFRRFRSYQEVEDQATMFAAYCQGLIGSAEFRYLN